LEFGKCPATARAEGWATAGGCGREAHGGMGGKRGWGRRGAGAEGAAPGTRLGEPQPKDVRVRAAGEAV